MDQIPRTVSEQTLLQEWNEIQAAQHNAAMFSPLYHRYYEQIFRFIYRRTADEQKTADICSQVFLKALQAIKTYQYKSVPFSAWLYRIASNEIAQHFRNSKKQRVVSLEQSDADSMMDEIQQNQSLDQEQLRTAFIESLNSLKPADLDLVEMRFFEYRSFKEIAEISGLSESNAKVKTYRILARMKKQIINKLDRS